MLPLFFLWPRVESSEIEKKKKDATAVGVDLMRVRIAHDNAQKLFFYPSFNSR